MEPSLHCECPETYLTLATQVICSTAALLVGHTKSHSIADVTLLMTSALLPDLKQKRAEPNAHKLADQTAVLEQQIDSSPVSCTATKHPQEAFW